MEPVPKPEVRRKRRRLWLALRWLVLAPLVLLVLLVVLVYLPPVQRWLGGVVTARLEERIGTPVRLDAFHLGFPAALHLEGLLVRDEAGDTLLYAGSVRSNLGVRALIDGRIEIGRTELDHVRAHLRQDADSTFNFAHIIRAFAGTDTTTVDDADTSSTPVSIAALVLNDVHYDMELQPSGLRLDIHLGHLDLPLQRMDATAVRFHAGAIELTDTRIDMVITPGQPEPDTYPDLGQPFEGLDLALRDLHLRNVAFSMRDAVTRDSLLVEVDHGEVAVDTMRFAQQHLHLRSVVLDGARFAMGSPAPPYVADTLPPMPPPWLDQHDGFRYWTRGFDLAADVITITQGDVSVHEGAPPGPGDRFDPAHIDLDDVELHAEALVVNDRLLTARLKRFTTVASDGTRLHAGLDLSASPQELRVTDARLRMDEADLAFTASAAIGDPSTAYHDPERIPLRVTLKSDLDHGTLAALLRKGAIAIPAPQGTNERWKTSIVLDGSAKQLDTLNIDLVGDAGTVLHLKGRVTEPSTLPHAPFAVEVRELALGAGSRQLLHAFVPPDVLLPHQFAGSLALQGDGRTIEGTMDLRSDLGSVAGSLSAAGITDSIPDEVNADLELSDVDLQRLLGDTSFGVFNAHVSAHELRLNGDPRSGDLEARIGPSSWHGQDLDGSTVNARLQGDSIFVDAGARAEALLLNAAVRMRWPARADSLSGDLVVDVERCQLGKLGIIEHELNINGRLFGTAQVHLDPREITASLEGPGLTLSNAQRSFTFEELLARCTLTRDSTGLELVSNALEAGYHANVASDSLPAIARQRMLSWFEADSLAAPHFSHRADLSLALPDPSWLTGLVVPELERIDLKEFKATWEGDRFETRIDLPALRYEGLELAQLQVQAEADRGGIDGELDIDSLRYAGVHLDGLSLNAASGADLLTTALRVQRGGVTRYAVEVELRRPDQALTVHVKDGLVLDTLSWEVDPRNLLRLAEQEGLSAEHFHLSHDEQHVELVTSAQENTLRFENFHIGSLLNMLTSGDSIPLVSGRLGGELGLSRSTDGPIRADLTVDTLTFMGNALGDMHAQAHGTAHDGYIASLDLANSANTLDADLRYTSAKQMDVQARFAFQELELLQPFVAQYLRDLHGGAKGDLRWKVEGGREHATGDIVFRDAQFGLVSTGTHYTLQEETIHAENDGVRFSHFTMLDSLGNAFELDGMVFLDQLPGLRFDLTLSTDSFQLMHSTAGKGKLVYGDLLTAMDLKLTGTTDDPHVRGEVAILPRTKLDLVLPGSQVELVSSEGIVEFTSGLDLIDTTEAISAEERLRDSLQAQMPKADLDLRIRVDRLADLGIVIDPTTGDRANFKGEADLRLRYSPAELMRVNGGFTVSEGGYTLEFYGLVKKRFDLVPGSTVTWDGDPVNARMDVRAKYISETSPLPLVSSPEEVMTETERERLEKRLPFAVLIHIGGTMKDPKVTFAIDLDRRYRNDYPSVDEELDRLAGRGQEEERNRQVFGLLVFNSFVQDANATNKGSDNLVTNAAISSVNGILTDQLNKAAGHLVKGVDIEVGVDPEDPAANRGAPEQSRVDYKVRKTFLDERLSFEVGGSFNSDKSQQTATTGTVSNTRAGTYAIIYDLTRDGRYRMRVFSENAYDVYDGEITDSGIAFMLTRDFDVKRDRRRKKEQQHEIVPAPTDR